MANSQEFLTDHIWFKADENPELAALSLTPGELLQFEALVGIYRSGPQNTKRYRLSEAKQVVRLARR
jgi:hypothetical protein